MHGVSTDAMVEILQRLPSRNHCRARLVCRRWHDLINQRIMESQSSPKLLIWNVDRGIAYLAIHVLTLGEATWREVSAGPASVICKLDAGIVSVKGMTYWVNITRGATAKIVMFDLVEERVISTTIQLPARHDRCRLTEVHERLACVLSPNVWVLEEGRRRWSHRYNFGGQCIPRRNFVYGEYVLTCKGLSFYGHRPKATSTCDQELTCDDMVQIGKHDEGTLVAKMTRAPEKRYDDSYETFAYIKSIGAILNYCRKSGK